MSVVAFELETATHHRHSACRIAVARLERGRVVERFTSLVRPPGLDLAQRADAPTLGELWPLLSTLLVGADRVVAHNAPFHLGVLVQSLLFHGVELPALDVECTLARARRLMPDLRNHRLDTLCDVLGIERDRSRDARPGPQTAGHIALALDWAEVMRPAPLRFTGRFGAARLIEQRVA